MDGSPLRSLRKRLHVNQKALAARLGVSEGAVRNIEDGRVSIDRDAYLEWEQVIRQMGKEGGDVADRVLAAL